MNQVLIKKIISFLAEINQECSKQKSAKKSKQLSSYHMYYNQEGYRDDVIDQWGHS